MIDLARYTELVVRQEVEHLEVFVGFETANRYSINTPDGAPRDVRLRGVGGDKPAIHGSHRPLTINVVDEQGQTVLTGSRKFFWFYSHLHVADGSDNSIGSLKRQFAMLRRRFSLMDANGSPVGRVDGALQGEHLHGG